MLYTHVMAYVFLAITQSFLSNFYEIFHGTSGDHYLSIDFWAGSFRKMGVAAKRAPEGLVP